MGTTLFLIDCQNDFIDDPMFPATLPVPGSFDDIGYRLCDLLTDHGDKINRVVLTMDQHPFNHIAHSVMWINRAGKNPPAFSTISLADVRAGKWQASVPVNQSVQAGYVENLETLGGVLTIWPAHCLIGTRGADIHSTLLRELRIWWQPNRELLIFPKSTNWKTEQYSSFQACVPVPDDPSTDFNYRLLDAINDDQILAAGEALSHCVEASLRDAIKFTPDFNLAERMVLLRDCTSPVQGFEKKAEDFVADFQKLGGRVTTSIEIFK
jgi:nicotinamidase/pyrazinamidase